MSNPYDQQPMTQPQGYPQGSASRMGTDRPRGTGCRRAAGITPS
ncbi:hypothetical protein [Microtetraspora fusca]|nr:hypothetical protein [Microtetraspora fusca]